MKTMWLQDLLNDIRRTRVAVVGDFCLDAYYFIDSSAAEISIETGLQTRPVRRKRFSLGGAGNVAHNLSALGVGTVYAMGVAGCDLYGDELLRLLRQNGIETGFFLSQETDWDTHVYTKLYDGDRELERVDFGNFNILHSDTMRAIRSNLEYVSENVDVVIINQQLVSGIHTQEFRESLKEFIKRHERIIFITDSRHYNDEYTGSIRKLNDSEGARICLPDPESVDVKDKAIASGIVAELYKRWRKPVFLTRGDRGCLVADDEGMHEIYGLHITSRIDTVGAGDSMLAGIAAALAAGTSPERAAQFGNFAAGVTVQKLFQTGIASPEEILAIGVDPDYRYNPELAASVRHAVYFEDSDIEICSPLSGSNRPVYAIFDHDGTVSTLRQGWESVMEPVMIEAILGERYKTMSEKEFQNVKNTVLSFIDKTTGIQTLVQMKGLTELVKSAGYVPPASVLDEFEYKALYNRRLLAMVEERTKRLEKGERDVRDYTLKNAVEFLKALRERGLTLFLASGTDQEDVEREAAILGYAELFNGGIYGARGSIDHEPKKLVLASILSKIGADQAQRIVTFGDGPVELRETKKVGGICVGVASDEVRRYGLNETKRTRLVLAGADMIIPDYSQMGRLLAVLFGRR